MEKQREVDGGGLGGGGAEGEQVQEIKQSTKKQFNNTVL